MSLKALYELKACTNKLIDFLQGAREHFLAKEMAITVKLFILNKANCSKTHFVFLIVDQKCIVLSL